MRFLSEAESAALITEELAYAAVRDALIAASTPSSTSFPSVLAHGSDPANRFTVKSAASSALAGAKIGSYWPGNDEQGLPRHNSIIMLFDQAVGRIDATIEAGTVNAYRTAAADAVAADALARPDATTLAIFGTGHQALYECVALSKVRPLETVHVVARSAERGERFLEQLASKGLSGVLIAAEDACGAADIIVTATTSRAPLFSADWVRPGTHVASMGSDAVGKQELPVALFSRARLFCDLPAQSRAIGEFQHLAGGTLTALGDVLTGTADGRVSPDDITVFDSSGIALQDLYVAASLLAISS